MATHALFPLPLPLLLVWACADLTQVHVRRCWAETSVYSCGSGGAGHDVGAKCGECGGACRWDCALAKSASESVLRSERRTRYTWTCTPSPCSSTVTSQKGEGGHGARAAPRLIPCIFAIRLIACLILAPHLSFPFPAHALLYACMSLYTV